MNDHVVSKNISAKFKYQIVTTPLIFILTTLTSHTASSSSQSSLVVGESSLELERNSQQRK